MNRQRLKLIALAIALIAPNANAKYCPTGVEHTPRHSSTITQFKRLYPCPYDKKTDGCVADHIMPLACGGADAIYNLQWQTKAASKLKDRWEICGDYRHKPCSGDRG